MKCATCRHWTARLTDRETQRECRRFPPGAYGWPTTGPDEGCGEHKPKGTAS